MPVAVACECGKRFAAPDHLLGQEVPCPSCGSDISIPAPASARTAPVSRVSTTAVGVRVDCSCGKAFLAPPSMQGQATRCPGCGGTLQVPSAGAAPAPLPDPLGSLDGYGHSAPLANPLAVRHPANSGGEIPWQMLILIGGGGAALLAVVIVITTALNWSQNGAVAQAPAAPQGNYIAPPEPPLGAPSGLVPEPATSGPSPFIQDVGSSPSSNSAANPPLTPEASPTPADGGVSNSTPVPGNSAPSHTPTNLAKLPDGLKAWYGQPNAQLAGLRRTGTSDIPLTHFSWMTGLLPYLDHGKVYERIDFTKPVTSTGNLIAGTTIIPEFLNPLDPRQRFEGYPLDRFALTHFVGMSGIEDARNVVAARLPRSDPRAGVFGYDEVARPEQITDGQSQTIMIVGAGELSNPWLFGGGATIRGVREPIFDKTSGLATKGLPGGGTIAVMADGSVRRINAKIDPAVFKAMSTIHGNERVDFQDAPATTLDSLDK